MYFDFEDIFWGICGAIIVVCGIIFTIMLGVFAWHEITDWDSTITTEHHLTVVPFEKNEKLLKHLKINKD